MGEILTTKIATTAKGISEWTIFIGIVQIVIVMDTVFPAL